MKALKLLQLCVLLPFYSHAAIPDRSFRRLGGGHRSLQAQQQSVGFVDKFLLYDSITDQPIHTLVDGDVLNLATLNTYNFNVEVTTTGGPVGSVKFGYNGKVSFRTESELPYCFCGSQGTDLKTCSALVVGLHNITVTTYSGIKANGTVGTTQKLTFRIVNDTLPLTDVPTNAPTSKKPTIASSSAPIFQPTTSTTSTIPGGPAICTTPKFNSSWERFAPDYPINPIEAQAAIIGSDLFITGSFVNNYTSATNRSYARDISVTNSPWRLMDDVPGAVGVTHAAVVAIATKVYICGGYKGPASGQHVDTCNVYDHMKSPGTGQWANFPSLPNNGTGGGAMFYDSERNAMYYTGGAQRPIVGSRYSKDVTNTWKYSFNDPSHGWVASTPIPYIANHQSVVTNRNVFGQERHFVLGGQKGDNEITKNVADMYEFIASNETWIRRASMPYERSHASISTHAFGCGFILAGGSRNGQKLNRTSDIHYYDIPSNNWTMIGSLPNVAATPAVFIDDNHFMYYVDHKKTSRRKINI